MKNFLKVAAILSLLFQAPVLADTLAQKLTPSEIADRKERLALVNDYLASASALCENDKDESACDDMNKWKVEKNQVSVSLNSLGEELINYDYFKCENDENNFGFVVEDGETFCRGVSFD